ncbi:MAG TPA: nitroreductase family protein, partial [Acidimicrobiales bacterium]|nr:nitroreductase family protein [Acidimicrobiales bacterium]
MELGDAIYSAVTTRYFSDEPVTDEQLQTAFNYARFAPQGGNRQPVRFIVVKDQEKRNQLAEWYRIPWKAYLADAQTGDISIGSDKAARLLKNADHFADHLEEVPVMVVACAHLEDTHPTDTELGRLSVVGGASIYPAVQNFILGCREAQL